MSINWNNKNEVLERVKENGYDLQHASLELQADREVVLAAIENQGLALEFASEELKNDKEVVLAAVANYRGLWGDSALKYASPELQAEYKGITREEASELLKDPSREYLFSSLEENNLEI